jgi:hypothetical protein
LLIRTPMDKYLLFSNLTFALRERYVSPNPVRHPGVDLQMPWGAGRSHVP